MGMNIDVGRSNVGCQGNRKIFAEMFMKTIFESLMERKSSSSH